MTDTPTNASLLYRLTEVERRLAAFEDNVRSFPVVIERVEGLRDEVNGLKRAIWAVVGSVLGGVLLMLVSIAAGWIGG